jgi:hypothetical protein
MIISVLQEYIDINYGKFFKNSTGLISYIYIYSFIHSFFA